jgi:hypothetical protein
VEHNIIFEDGSGRISRPAAEVYVEAAIAEAALKQFSAQQAANIPIKTMEEAVHQMNGSSSGNGAHASSSEESRETVK